MSQAVRLSPCQHDESVGAWTSLQLTLRASIEVIVSPCWYGIASVDVMTYERGEQVENVSRHALCRLMRGHTEGMYQI